MGDILHQLRLVVFFHYLQGIDTSQVVVWDFFHQQYEICVIPQKNKVSHRLSQIPKPAKPTSNKWVR